MSWKLGSEPLFTSDFLSLCGSPAWSERIRAYSFLHLLILLILLGVPALYCWYKLRSSRSDDIPPEYVKRSQQLLKIVIILALVSAFAIFLLRIKAGI